MTIDPADIANTLEYIAKLLRDASSPVEPCDDPVYKAALLAVSQGGVEFLQRALHVNDDGIVGPDTRGALEKADLSILIHDLTKVDTSPPAPPTSGDITIINENDIYEAAAKLGCKSAFVHAVIDVEVGTPFKGAVSGFIPDGRPDILFESHQFHRHTDGKYDSSHPDLSTDSWIRNYGKAGAHQWDRLESAMALDRNAAIRSASWGMFQVMGDEFEEAGFTSLDDFVSAMKTGQKEHLDAFVSVIQHRSRCLSAAQANPPLFAQFARYYNGAGYAANQYDAKLEAAYNKWNT